MIKTSALCFLLFSCANLYLLAQDSPQPSEPLEKTPESMSSDPVKKEISHLTSLIDSMAKIAQALDSSQAEPKSADAGKTEKDVTVTSDEILDVLSSLLNSKAPSKSGSGSGVAHQTTGQPTLDSVLLDFIAAGGKIIEEVVDETSNNFDATNPSTNSPTLDSTLQDFISVSSRMFGEIISEANVNMAALEPAKTVNSDEIAQQNKELEKQIELQQRLNELMKENQALKKQLEEK